MDNQNKQLQNQTMQERISEHEDEILDIAKNIVTAATTKPTWQEKFKSRKFWIAIAGIVAGICGIIGCNDNTTAIIIFAILEILSVGMYCITEGNIDTNRARSLMDSAMVLFEMVLKKTSDKTANEMIEDAKNEPDVIKTTPMDEWSK